MEPVEKSKFYSSLLYNGTTPRIQNQGEQVVTFASEIERIVMGAHPLTETGDDPNQTLAMEKVRDKILQNAFVGGLLDDVKEKVLDAEPESFQKALEIAKKAEARNFLRKKIDPGALPTNETFQNVAMLSCNPDQAICAVQPGFNQNQNYNQFNSTRRTCFDLENEENEISFIEPNGMQTHI